MEIKLEKSSKVIINNKNEFDEFWSNLQNELQRENLILKKANIDGVQAFENLYNTIIDNLDSISTIEMYLTTPEEMYREVVDSLYNYLAGLPENLEDLANEFYIGPSEETWHNFKLFLEGIEWVTSALKAVSNYREDSSNNLLEFHNTQYNNLLNQMFEALNTQDYMLLGDLIQYDFLEQVELTLDALRGL